MKYNKITIITNPAGIEIISAALIEEGVTEFQIDNPRDTLDMIEGLKPTEWYDPDQIPEALDEPAKIVIWEPVEEGENKAEAGTKHHLEAEIEHCWEAVAEAEARTHCEPGPHNGLGAMTDVTPLILATSSIVERIKSDLSAGFFGESADLGALEIIAEVHQDDEWKDKWKEYFRPTRVSERIVVKPTWWKEEDGVDSANCDTNNYVDLSSLAEDDIVIEIDPGQAFGTGTHETTSLTLKHMEDYIKPGDRVLDVGVGSGILSIAAVKLGASEVLGIDIDEEAVRVSKENFQLNGVDGYADAIQGDLLNGLKANDLREKADVVVANLLSDLVIMLTPAVKDYIKPGGIYISSGILIEKEHQVAEAIKASGFTITETKYDGEWCSIAATYRP